MAATEDEQDPQPSGWDELIAANLLRLRTDRGLSTTRLAALLKEAGQSIPATGITRIEKGQRRVSAADIVALAIVLRVSPLTLLLPWTDRPDAQIEIPGAGEVTADDLWKWADGYLPLSLSDADPHGDIQRYRLDSRPAWAREWLRYVSWSQLVKAVSDHNERGREMLENLGPPWSDKPDASMPRTPDEEAEE